MKSIDLAGPWELVQMDTGETLAAEVPGDTYSANLAAGRIPDPYWAENEEQVQWVRDKDWKYRREFTVNRDLLKEESVFLNCDSLDTIAEVRINDALVGCTDNMFRRHRFEVKPLLRKGSNTIEILLRTPLPVAKALADSKPFPYPSSGGQLKVPHLNMLRKVQCHAGWDWGIRLVVAGIYGRIYLGGRSAARIDHVYTTQKHTSGRCEVEVTVEAEAPRPGKTTLQVRLGESAATVPVVLQPGTNRFSARLTVDNPRLWWPVGQGGQHLYDLSVTLGDDMQTKKLGLRALAVVNDPDPDGSGSSMMFRVNGRDTFCKGANWIPSDAMPQRQTPQRYRQLLESAVAANMNMIRVWGGGQYENDIFYELCDQLGLLVWHDFMFACAMYPSDDTFLENVQEEVRYQVKRLRDHACIAIWCGDNENVGALNWFAETRENRDRYVVGYDRLNHGILEKTVHECDPTRLFWPSSPCAGPGDYSNNWSKDNRGDMHYWAVWHSRKPFEAYYEVRPRFCSEFGYQSFPSPETVRTYAPESQWNVTAPVMECHQRHHAGNSFINDMFGNYFRLPDGFENHLWLSQLQQALGIRMGVEFWRTLRPRCMGAIYWQLNDVWPVCSWSSIEYGGKWKLLHYMARRFFAPVAAVTVQRDPEQAEIWVVSDEPSEVTGSLTARVCGLDGSELQVTTHPIALDSAGSSRVAVISTADLPLPANACFLELYPETGGLAYRNTHFFDRYKRCELPAATVQAEPIDSGERLGVKLRADSPAFYVSLDLPGIRGAFDDNCFTLLPGEERTVWFETREKVDGSRFAEALAVRHLRQTYR